MAYRIMHDFVAGPDQVFKVGTYRRMRDIPSEIIERLLEEEIITVASGLPLEAIEGYPYQYLVELEIYDTFDLIAVEPSAVADALDIMEAVALDMYYVPLYQIKAWEVSFSVSPVRTAKEARAALRMRKSTWEMAEEHRKWMLEVDAQMARDDSREPEVGAGDLRRAWRNAQWFEEVSEDGDV